LSVQTQVKTYPALVRRLALACELEHGLCLQYLFTAFTLKDSLNEGGLTMEEFTYVRKWKANLFLIGAQEMLHLAQAANLSAAVGSGLNLRRPNFPQRPSYYPTGLPWGLWPFSREAIILYALYERPTEFKGKRPEWLPTDPYSEGTFETLLVDAPTTKDPFNYLPDEFDRPQASSYITIEELYREIAEGFRHIPSEIMVGPEWAQVPADMVDMPQLIRVRNRDEALEAVKLIIDQGEGSPSDRVDSHFGLFVAMYNEYMQLKARRPEFEPARDVQSNPLSRLHPDNTFPGWRLIKDPFTRQVNDLNNNIYALMLQMLRRVFHGISETAEARKRLAAVCMRLMTGLIVPLGEALTQLPMGDDPSTAGRRRARFAGPSFEMQFTQPDLPFSEAAWHYYREQLIRLEGTAGELAAEPGAPDALDAAARTLLQLSDLTNYIRCPSTNP
jgi:hypothetical protein